MSNLPSEPEFEQAYSEVAATLEPLFKKHPEYRRALEIIAIPERIIQFRVVWETDKGEVKVNRGFRVQFNSALGPYKGGLRLHPTVNLSVLKFLGFEQVSGVQQWNNATFLLITPAHTDLQKCPDWIEHGRRQGW
jgi:glutamate dehydrogenase (NADP+)